MPADAPVSVALVAVGGYGHHYLQSLWNEIDAADYVLAGAIDPEARRSSAFESLRARGVPLFDDLESFHASGRAADLVVVASPIHWHVPHALAALAQGAHVLCEKPIAATVQEALALAAARDAAARWVMIGYQWSFSSAVLALRRDIASGRYGAPRRLRALCCWPRSLEYYRRNGWAGRRRDPATGRWVLDSPANNAMAHFLHNLFYLIGGRAEEDARPASITAETARANPIEMFDTVACRAVTGGGTEVLFFASHATEACLEPRFRVELERATVSFRERADTIEVIDRAGRIIDYGSPDGTPQFEKLRVAIAASRDPGRVLCPVESALWQTLAVDGIDESAGEPVALPGGPPAGGAADRIVVGGLDADLVRCYEAGALPSEAGVGWSRPGRAVDLTGYDRFPGGPRTGEDPP